MKVNEQDFSVIAFDVVSLFHVYSCVASFLEFSHQPCLVIFLKKNKLDEYCLPERNFEIDGREIQIKHCKESDNKKKWVVKFFVFLLIKLLFKRKKNALLIHHTYFKPTGLRYFSFRNLANLEIVSFEEGIGTYGDIRHHQAIALRESKKHPRISFLIKKTLTLLVDKKFSILIKKDSQSSAVSNFSLSVAAVNKIFYKEKLKSIENEIGSEKSVCILFPSPGFVIFSQTTEEDYKKKLIEVQSQMHEFELFVKPHPLDEHINFYEKNGFKVLPRNIPAELFFSLNQSVTFVGSVTGSMLVAKNVYDMDCYFFPGLVESDSKAIRDLFTSIKVLE